jgi:hypothetical protein
MNNGICSASKQPFLTSNSPPPSKCYYHRQIFRTSLSLIDIKESIDGGLFCKMAVTHLMKLTDQLTREIS